MVPELLKVELPTFEDVTKGCFFDELDSQNPETIRYACADSDYALRLYHVFNNWFDEYLVLTPITDGFDVFADNLPGYEVSEVRISLFIKSNYIQRKNQITKLLLLSGFTITGRWYVEYEQDTGYHHYAIDVAKEYKFLGGDRLGNNRP